MAAGDVIVIRESAGGRPGVVYLGSDDYTLHDAHAVARQGAGDTAVTYTAWIFLDNITTTMTILSAGDNNSANEYLSLDSVSGKLRVFVKDTATQLDVIETTASLVARQWMHVAIVQNGVRPTLYVNGVASAMTDTTPTDLTRWYGDLGGVDKFAIGVLESNATHTNDLTGAVGQVKYWSLELTAEQIRIESLESLNHSTSEQTRLDAALQFNVTYENDGITDSGLGADNGTLTGNAYYGDNISPWSYKVSENITGHAAEFINTIIDGNKYVSIIKRGD